MNDLVEGSKILLDTDLKIILLDHQNNFAGTLMNDAKVLIFQQVWAFYIIILIVQQNYFFDLYSAKILDLSTKPFSSWMNLLQITYL